MKWADLRLRMRALILRKRLERDLQGELDFHVDMMVRKNVARGMSPEEARRQAAIKFGPSANIAEQCRDERRVHFIDTLLNDVHYALRQFRRAPGFVAVAILSLALGIGANTAIFTAIDALMLKVLPVRDPQQLVSFRTRLSFGGTENWLVGVSSYSAFEEMRQRTTVFADMAAIFKESVFIDGAQTRIAVVSAGYFTTLGVNAAEGRAFTADEDRGRGNHPVAVISHAYWRRHYD
jgi:hypothetical protein